MPQAGTYVARFSMREIRQGVFLREAIELAAVEAVAPVITEDQLVRLRRNLRVQEAMVEDEDYPGFYRLDGEMHEMILFFKGIRKLVRVAETAWVHVNWARQLILPMPGRVVDTLEEHGAILAALEARDMDAARTVMRRHLGQLITFLKPLEKEHPELFAPS